MKREHPRSSPKLAGVVILVAALSGSAQEAPLEIRAADEVRLGAGVRGGVDALPSGALAFRYDRPDVSDVELQGSWDGWQRHALSRGEDGLWGVRMRVPPGDHQYRYLVSGFPSPDPANPLLGLADDGGLASRLSVTPGFAGIGGDSPVSVGGEDGLEPSAVSPAPVPPLLGPLRFGVRYRGVTRKDYVEGADSPLLATHALDIPVDASLPGRAWLNLVFDANARAGTDDAELRLLRMQASSRVSQARVRLTRNAAATPDDARGWAPLRVVEPVGRHGYVLGLEAQSVAMGMELPLGFRFSSLESRRDDGQLGNGSRLQAIGVSGRLGAIELDWSGAVEKDRQTRLVRRGLVVEEPAEVDTLRQEERRSRGSRVGFRFAPKSWGSVEFDGHWIWGKDGWRGQRELIYPGPVIGAEISGEQTVMRATAYGLTARGKRYGLQGEAGWTQESQLPAFAPGVRVDRWFLGVSDQGEGDVRHLSLVHRRVRGSQDPARDPWLGPWVWRGVPEVHLGDGEEMARVDWWHVPLSGLPATTALLGNWQGVVDEVGASVGMELVWAGGSRPALTTLSLGGSLPLGRDLVGRFEALVVHRDQPDLGLAEPWRWLPQAAVSARPAEGLEVSLGVGIDPWVDDPLTREHARRGREDELRGIRDHQALLGNPSGAIPAAMASVTSTARIKLEVIYQFGAERPRLGRSSSRNAL